MHALCHHSHVVIVSFYRNKWRCKQQYNNIAFSLDILNLWHSLLSSLATPFHRDANINKNHCMSPMVVLNVFISTCIKIFHLKDSNFATKTWPQQSPRVNRDEVYLFEFYFPSNATANSKGNMPCILQSCALKKPFNDRPMHGMKMKYNVIEDKIFHEAIAFRSYSSSSYFILL